jgi:hypothetical protein
MSHVRDEVEETPTTSCPVATLLAVERRQRTFSSTTLLWVKFETAEVNRFPKSAKTMAVYRSLVDLVGFG